MDQPSWMAEACPSWCVRRHEEADHPDDRRHQGRAAEVQAVVASDPIPTATGVPRVLVVQLDQPIDAPLPWIRIEAAEAAGPRLAVRAADAIELARAILAAVSP